MPESLLDLKKGIISTSLSSRFYPTLRQYFFKKMITRFVQFCFCLSLILTQSCKDDESTGKLVLDETIYDEDNGLFDKYFYDDKGVATRAEYYSDDKLASYSVYAYADGRHVSRDYYMIGVGGDPQLYSTTTFQYDLDDNLSEVLTQSVSREIVYKTTWSNEQITKVERTQNNVSTFVEYKYDGKNNVSVITAYSDDGSLDYVLEIGRAHV